MSGLMNIGVDNVLKYTRHHSQANTWDNLIMIVP